MLLPHYTNVRAFFLYNLPKENCWYFQAPKLRTVDKNWDREPDPLIDQSGTAVAISRVGDGYVGFIGDTNCELGTNLAMIRMFNLPGQQHTMEEI